MSRVMISLPSPFPPHLRPATKRSARDVEKDLVVGRFSFGETRGHVSPASPFHCCSRSSTSMSDYHKRAFIPALPTSFGGRG
ncbi:hypothetical protein AVEN_70160-1 [Araneus ventricosus]|uniref:Uncharacterized protein n=1 Tax=Araneus ventricosus TaxID=182803 RepID=A0A4Y2WQC0_ARAVE|nr:hypothetical protein AVEN_70160-1 [Araneus ventricosus]